MRACGRQEYLIGDSPLSRFLYVRNSLAKEEIPSFIVVDSRSVVLDSIGATASTSTAITQDAEAATRNSRNSFPTLRQKQTISSWNVDSFFSFRIESVSLLNTTETEVGIQAGIFHGGRSLCEPRKTTAKTCANGECTWNEDLIFDLKVNLFVNVFKVSFTIHNYFNRCETCPAQHVCA